MQTPGELLLELLKKDGQPDRALVQYEAFSCFFAEPISSYLRGSRPAGNEYTDKWGVTIAWEEGSAGPMPVTTDEKKVLKDITHWRDYVKAPDISHLKDADWESARIAGRKAAGADHLLTAFMGTGIFEQCHFLMGFEDTLTAMYEHPQEMHELIDYILQYRLQYVTMLLDGLKPDALLSHDDWGTKNALFMKPDMWRKFFKEPYRKFYGEVQKRGVIAVHHADSYLAPIVEDMAEIGIQVWQGTLPENDIPALQEKLDGRMVLMGGIGAAIDRVDATEEEIRAYVRNVCSKNCPGGHFIPCITYGLPKTVYPHVEPIISDEIRIYNETLHARRFVPQNSVRRHAASKAVSGNTVDASAKTSNVIADLSDALYKGQKKKVLTLAAQAIREGIQPSAILSDGLMNGMTKIGDDFSTGKVFVPEMLMAARCMAAATEYLKPFMTTEGSEVIGRACLGTVRGDMHDIGKNLVKIMMEGAGIEVIDLGTDVPAEAFVQTAIDRQCDIIALSSLLTTSMNNMRDVVKLAEERGIRDKVKIMIGGAPTSREFCEEIGADVWTEDAGAAARSAVELLKT